jgi:hypothetical protein
MAGLQLAFAIAAFQSERRQGMLLTQRRGVAILTVDWASSIGKSTRKKIFMPKYVIEREIPDAGKLGTEQLQAISQKSCGVLRDLGPQIQWVESYVTDDKIYCVYIAPNEEIVRKHAEQGGFPANRISEVRSVIDPTTAESSSR